MKIRIIKSNSETYWYAHKIGHIFEVREIGNNYVTEDSIDTAIRSLIDKDDAEIVE